MDDTQSTRNVSVIKDADRCASDEKMYLYDIIDIKKETSNSFD